VYVNNTQNFINGVYTVPYNFTINTETLFVLNNSLGAEFIFNVNCSGGVSLFGSAGQTFKSAAA
jgi:hypothetical protein